MPGVVVTSFFLDNEDWSPVGIIPVVPHVVIVASGQNAVVASGQFVTVGTGIPAVVAAGQDVSVGRGIVVRVGRGNDVEEETGDC